MGKIGRDTLQIAWAQILVAKAYESDYKEGQVPLEFQSQFKTAVFKMRAANIRLNTNTKGCDKWRD